MPRKPDDHYRDALVYATGQFRAGATTWLVPLKGRPLDGVLRIEQASFDDPWRQCEFTAVLKARCTYGLAALHSKTALHITDCELAGYLVYRVKRHALEILNLAVAPRFRRRGVGRQFVEELIAKLKFRGRRRVEVAVGELNLAGQLFFRACGFVAVGTLLGHYHGQDAYTMRYELPIDAGGRVLQEIVLGEARAMALD